MKRVAAYGFTFIVSLLIALPALAEKRVALVIGNAKYQHAARLDNPLRDAAKIADLLTKRGFEAVHRENLTLSAMRKVLKRFKRVARGSDIALLYFSGHGMEMQGDNYLIPIDAELARDDEVEDEAITLEKAQKSLRGARKLRLVILDACRNNPFAAKMTHSAGLTRSVSKGFAPVRVEGNILVTFAAKAGTVAYDGDGQNSPFAGAMLKHLFRPGLDIRRAFGYVRDDVRLETGGKQDPFLYGSLGGDIVPLAPGVQAKPSPASPFDKRASELAYWNAISNSKDPYKFEIFLRQFPNGTFAALAQHRKNELMEQRRKDRSAASREHILEDTAITGNSVNVYSVKDLKECKILCYGCACHYDGRKKFSQCEIFTAKFLTLKPDAKVKTIVKSFKSLNGAFLRCN